MPKLGKLHRDGETVVCARERINKRKRHLEVVVDMPGVHKVYPCLNLLDQQRLFAVLCRRSDRELLLGKTPVSHGRKTESYTINEWCGFVLLHDLSGEWMLSDGTRVSMRHALTHGLCTHSVVLADTLALDAAEHFGLRTAGTL